MTSQIGKKRWQRALSGGLAVGAVIAGVGAPSALADPVTPTPTPSDAAAAPQMTADQALAIIAQDYDTGAGGGQLSNLVHTVLKLRAQGFKPSNANKAAIVDALDQRPNQAPLIEALTETIAYQRKLQARTQNAQPQNPPMDLGAYPPGQGPAGLPPGVDPNQGGINIPLPVG